jgi:hypothetical protein
MVTRVAVFVFNRCAAHFNVYISLIIIECRNVFVIVSCAASWSIEELAQRQSSVTTAKTIMCVCVQKFVKPLLRMV